MRLLTLVFLAVAMLQASAGAAQPGTAKSTAERISGHIQQSGQLRNYRIGVTYDNGVATLAGTVTNPQQHDAAIRLAKEVDGVKRVVSRLEFAAPGEKEGNEGASTLLVRPTRQAANTADYRDARSGVVQAYGVPQQPQPMPQRIGKRAPMMSPGRRPNVNDRPQPMRRAGGMPRPIGLTVPDPNVRPASADCYQAGGAGAPGYGGMAAAGMMGGAGMGMGGMPSGVVPTSYGHGPAYENPSMPGYSWPSYAAYPNYAALSYPQQYSPTAWPYIGPFYPYPQVPLAWRKVALEWDDGWWFLDFSAHNSSH